MTERPHFGAAVFDFRTIAARLARKELQPICTGCECTLCRNPKGLPCP